MFKFFARRSVRNFGIHYDYDTAYMEYILNISPSAFFKFSKLAALASHNDNAPVEAAFVAKLVGAVAEDCGPCVQLVVNMAREAGVELNQISAVLQRDIDMMNKSTKLAFRFADAIVQKTQDLDAVRETIKATWGEAAVIDLTFAVQIGRVFPMLKNGLGYATACQKVDVNATSVDVIKVSP